MYGWEPGTKPMRGAAFMNQVRYKVVSELKEKTGLPVHAMFGSATKTARQALCIEKTHANDAFVMGRFHPKHRQREEVYVKRRRNSRILSRFYDARYMDIRDGKVKSGQELSCGRTKRCEPRHSKKDLRTYRGHKVRKGRVSIRKQHYAIRPGTAVLYGGRKMTVKSVFNKGAWVRFKDGTNTAVKRIKVLRYPGSWICVS